MPLADPRPLTREEFHQLQERLDYINAHAENDGAGFSPENAQEILEIANVFYAGMVYYLLRFAERALMTPEEARRELGLRDWRDGSPHFRLTDRGATFEMMPPEKKS